ncbi:MAG: conjugal transfer protein TraX, partial [Clostridia bacterium]|nr:conjugal transfer protein TraX [Clostridia bacterium]
MYLNRTQLKYIAAAAMLLDHIGMMFIPVSTPLGTLCRLAGRLTAPIMCMFIAEGFRYTKSKARYAARLLIFALISQPFYAFAHGETLMTSDLNMIFTLFLSFVMLCLFEKLENNLLKILAVSAIVVLSQFGDWGITAPLWVLGFYCFSKNKNKQT